MMLIDGVIMCVHILQCATNISQQTWTIQYNTIQFRVKKCLWRCSHFTVKCGKEENKFLVLNVCKHFEDVTFDGTLFKVRRRGTLHHRSWKAMSLVRWLMS